jgi:hypothetical protein
MPPKINKRQTKPVSIEVKRGNYNENTVNNNVNNLNKILY